MARVSVVMPVYNGARFVADALACIENQSLRDIEIIAVDDGSNDGTWELLSAAARRDDRVRTVRNERNEGLRAALNRGLGLATAPLVARQDADDVLAPEGLARQVAEFYADPSLVLLGCAFDVVQEGRPPQVGRMPESDTAIRWRMLFDNPFCHTSVMFRRVAPDGWYPRYESYRCEDYDLWARMLAHGRGRNLPDPLVTRREHADTYSVRAAGPQAKERTRIALREIRRVYPRTGLATEDVERIHRWDDELPSILGPAEIRLCTEIADVLVAFARQPAVDRTEARLLARRWTERMLNSLPDYRYRAAWRAGLLPRLMRLAPVRVALELAGRLGRRMRTCPAGAEAPRPDCDEEESA